MLLCYDIANDIHYRLIIFSMSNSRSALNKTVFPKDESPERVQSVNSAPNQTIPSAVPKVTSPHARHILSGI